MMKWFGQSWGAPICDPETHAPTPVGEKCSHCGECVVAEDYGVIMPHGRVDGSWSMSPMHYECYMRMIIGGANHQLGSCTCCGGDQPPDPPSLSIREAAVLAVNTWERKNRDTNGR